MLRHIPVSEKEIDISFFFQDLDLDYPGLERVRAALSERDTEKAGKYLVDYMQNRTNVEFLFDYRRNSGKQIPSDVLPYLFQASVGLKEPVKDFCLYAGKKMMQDIYIVPGSRKEQIKLGNHWENSPHFHTWRDQGKRSRRPSNLFTRGQWMEYLFFLYQETGEPGIARKLEHCLKQFWRNYPLMVEDETAEASRFQFSEDRTVMSVGWLAFAYLELLYTELAYEMEVSLTFQVIVHMWYLAVQFCRFQKDEYKSHNHHLWERGLVPFIFGVMFPEFKSLRQMEGRGAEVICRHVKEDFGKDGGYSEHTIAYWAGAALGEMLMKGIYLARKNKRLLLDKEASGRLEQSCRLLAVLAPPGECYPSLGDGEGPMVNQVLRMCGEYLGSSSCLEMLAFREGLSREKPSLPLYYGSDESGYLCARSGWGKEDTYLLMSVKRGKEQECSGHRHMDMLSLFLTVRGEEVIGEPCAGALYHYGVMGSPQRGYLYNMTSHNQVLAYGKPIQEDRMYAEGWELYPPECALVKFCCEGNEMHARGEHEGYSFCRITREIDFLPGEIRVRDGVSQGRRLEQCHIQRWHLMPGVTCTELTRETVLMRKGRVKVLATFPGAERLQIWKNTELPDSVKDELEEMPEWILDVEFRKSEDDENGRDGTAWQEGIFQDITDWREEEISKK